MCGREQSNSEETVFQDDLQHYHYEENFHHKCKLTSNRNTYWLDSWLLGGKVIAVLDPVAKSHKKAWYGVQKCLWSQADLGTSCFGTRHAACPTARGASAAPARSEQSWPAECVCLWFTADQMLRTEQAHDEWMGCENIIDLLNSVFFLLSRILNKGNVMKYSSGATD